MPFSSLTHLSEKEPYNECLQGTGNRVNIGVINYRGRKKWQSNPMIIVTVEMRSHADAQGRDVTEHNTHTHTHTQSKKTKHMPSHLVPL